MHLCLTIYNFALALTWPWYSQRQPLLSRSHSNCFCCGFAPIFLFVFVQYYSSSSKTTAIKSKQKVKRSKKGAFVSLETHGQVNARLNSQLYAATHSLVCHLNQKGNMRGIRVTWWNCRFSLPLPERGHKIPEFRVKLCFLAFLGHSPGAALRAIQSHISIAAIILAFYRVWRNEMGFCNHITVLNTSPQNESTTKQGKEFLSASCSRSECPHLRGATYCGFFFFFDLWCAMCVVV